MSRLFSHGEQLAIVKSSGPLSCKVGGNSTVGIQIRIHPIVLLKTLTAVGQTLEPSVHDKMTQ